MIAASMADAVIEANQGESFDDTETIDDENALVEESESNEDSVDEPETDEDSVDEE